MNTKEIMTRSQQVAHQMLDLLFPPTCSVCKKSGHVLCPTCMGAIPLLRPPFCQHCSNLRLSPGSTLCWDCQRRPVRLSGIRTASSYQDPLRTCIHALKYDGTTRLAEPLGALLSQAYLLYGMQADLLLPVPLHAERQRHRGFNQSYLLAEVCARHLGVPLYDSVLLRTRATTAQVHVSAGERQQNVAGAFLCTPPFATGALHGRSIIIIDDVCTTGATLEACAAPLFAAGARSVWGLVLARPL